MKNLSERKLIAKKHIEPKLNKLLKIFFVLMATIICVVIFKIFQRDIGLFLAIKGLAAGTIVGFGIGKMFKMLWHPENEKVISRLDKYGIISILLYISIEIGRKWFFSHWLQGEELNAFGLIFLSGLFLGRLLSMIRGIKTVLIEERKI
jgi:hypothetical protein